MREMDFKIEGKTLDTQDEVFILREGKSLINGCYSKKEKKIYCWLVYSYQKGDFKKMMNFVCEKYKTEDIIFTSTIGQLNFVLKGFKETEHYHKGMKEMIPCLEGKWKLNGSNS